MKKSSVLIVLVATLSSCVYSLFPIYTEDTLVFKKELLGKWATNEDGSEYLLFESTFSNNNEEEKEIEYTHKVETEDGFKIEANGPIIMMVDGDTITDEQTIKEALKGMISNIKTGFDEKDLKESIGSQAKKKDFNGTISMYEEKSYRLKVVTNNEEQDFTAHLVNIGGDLFMDIYPKTNYSSNIFTENYFPVHTFYKVEISESEFKLTSFDLEKLNKLFESNLIRMRHENVEGTILITAQPKELQKFIDKYADDDSVFEETETYIRVTP